MQEEQLRKGPWNEEEDERLERYVKLLGEQKWDSIARVSGLKRSGKSCRMRWLNYLRPSIKRGHISAKEEQIIIQLQKQWGNKWSKIARKLPGRTDNDIKNYWRTYLRKKIHAKEGNLECDIKNTKQDCTSQKFNIGLSKPVDDNKENADSSLALCDLSSLAYPISPYEIRLFEWMSVLSSDQNEPKHYSRCYLASENEDNGDDSILDTLCYLWDMN